MSVVNLTDLSLPPLNEQQLDKFTFQSIHAQKLQDFNGAMAVEKLQRNEGHKVLAADFGGDKGLIKLFKVQKGQLIIDEGYDDYIQGNNGEGYVACLEKAAAYSASNNIPFGISWGGPLEGSKPLFHPKATRFLDDLSDKYEGDLAKLSPKPIYCFNDGPAGLIAGAVEVNRSSKVRDILFAINGGGLGLAVLSNNIIYTTEAGHVEGIDALNTYNQTEPCGVFGAEYVCIERLGSNKAGIEAQWQDKKGSYMRAKDIEDRYKEGDELARDLYDHSAFVVAHMIAGSARVFNIDLSQPDTAVVCHGGAFKFPHYGQRLQQIIGQGTAGPRLVMTQDFGSKDSNTCLDGVAYAALLA